MLQKEKTCMSLEKVPICFFLVASCDLLFQFGFQKMLMSVTMTQLYLYRCMLLSVIF